MSNDVVNYFLELIAIDSESKDERAMADRVKADLEALGATVEEDSIHLKTGGNAGNLHALIPGRIDKQPILFCAHLDTVKPGKGIKPRRENGRIRSDGSTVLGGDDKSGVAEIIMGIKSALESGVDHAPIEVLFTVSEEIGLLGAKHFDKSKLRSAFGYAMDAHRVGDLVLGAPAQNSIRITIQAAHAEGAGERHHAIRASEAIAAMPLGRIDYETTCNMGIIRRHRHQHCPNKADISGEAQPNARSWNSLRDIRRADSAVKRHDYPSGRLPTPDMNTEYNSRTPFRW